MALVNATTSVVKRSAPKRRGRRAHEGAQATAGHVVPALLRRASTSPRITGWPLAARLGRKECTDASRAIFQRVRCRAFVGRRNNSFIAAEDFFCVRVVACAASDSRASTYFPMQNREKISPSRSSAVNSPVIDEKAV